MKEVRIACLLAFLCYLSPAAAQVVKAIDLDKSHVKWQGSNLFNFGSHEGTVSFASGQLLFKEEQLTGGRFVVDMNTIVNTDGKFSRELVDHLKSDDFFAVEEFPNASFTLTNVTHKIDSSLSAEGTLEIKGITHPVHLDVTVQASPLTYHTVFIIDRAKWNIRYGSRSFFDLVGDEIISDAIKLEVTIVLQASDNR